MQKCFNSILDLPLQMKSCQTSSAKKDHVTFKT